MEMELSLFLTPSYLFLLAIWAKSSLTSADSIGYLKVTEENTGGEPLGVTFQPSMT